MTGRRSKTDMTPVPILASHRVSQGGLNEVKEQITRDLLNQERYHLHQQQQQQQQQQKQQQQLMALQQQLEMVKQQAELDRLMNRMKLEVNEVRQTTVARQQPFQPDYTDVIEDVPVLLQSRFTPSPSHSAQPDTVYDPGAGFVLFCDYVLGIEMSMQVLRLVTVLYKVRMVVRDPMVLPKVSCDSLTSTFYGDMGKSVVIGAVQAHTECPADKDLCFLVEVQIASVANTARQRTVRLTTQAWCKIPLFDDQSRLNAGRWRVKLKALPIQHDISFSQINNIPQFGSMELFFRLAHSCESNAQSLVPLLATDMNRYSYLSQLQLPRTDGFLPPPSVTPPGSQATEPDEDEVFGFQIDRVKNAEHGRAKVKLVAYHLSTDQVVQNASSPVEFITSAVTSNFKCKYHIFGRQEAIFQDVAMTDDMLVIARLYLRPTRDNVDYRDDVLTGEDGRLNHGKTLVAWAALPLTKGDKQLNTGTHQLQLFQPPVPKISAIPFRQRNFPKQWKRYGRATLRVYIFRGLPRPGSLTPSDRSEDDEDDKICPPGAWLHYERSSPPTEPFHAGDGFDLYVDGCLNLPDAVTISRVSATVLDRSHGRVSREIGTTVSLDSDIHNPVYELRTEFRKPNMPATSTLLLKLVTMTLPNRQLVIGGYATLNIFVETGTEEQPIADTSGIQISLNEGAHQLRLYHQEPNDADPFTEACLQKSVNRVIPCATVLVRLLKTPLGPSGLPLEISHVHRVQWERLGLWQPRPRYRDRIYYSLKCRPTSNEAQLFHALLRRGRVNIRSVIPKLADPPQIQKFTKDKAIENFIRNQLTMLMDVESTKNMDLTFVVSYSPVHGIKCAVDCALGLPWSSFSYVLVCLNPPAAIYRGNTYAKYDKPMLTEKLVVQSTTSNPIWRDGYKHFPDRCYHEFLTVILHLQEVVGTQDNTGNKYKLVQQAWSAVQVFRSDYACTDTYKLPLFHGKPPQEVIQQLTQMPCIDCLKANVRNRTKMPPNGDYLPPNFTQQTMSNVPNRPLADLVPTGQIPQEFMKNLAVKFKNLVYKANEDETTGSTAQPE
ncbi:hypothetical protein LSAT2_023748 [Lamellibrachia satsuma]|nr:hypothetical protein LSAT2_023748 [Lamellibrachia satsuma]